MLVPSLNHIINEIIPIRSADLTIPQNNVDNPETLILTCPPIRGDEEMVHRSRETTVTNIQRQLRRRGVSLRKHYPDVHARLRAYAEGSSGKFVPVTVHPKDGTTGKSFVCIIMPDAEPESVEQVAVAGVRVCTVDVLSEQ